MRCKRRSLYDVYVGYAYVCVISYNICYQTHLILH